MYYVTDDKIKLMVYASVEIDSDLIFILKDESSRKLIHELIQNESFILNKLNERELPVMLDSLVE